MIKKLNLKNAEISKDVMDLQAASYKVEAELIDFYELPPLKDTVDSLQTCDEVFYGYFVDEILAGILSYKIIDNVLDIHRVAIHPRFFRMGIADKLISFIENLHCNIGRVVVCTGKKNLPAVNLYLKKGYIKNRDIEISKGIYITEFTKVLE